MFQVALFWRIISNPSLPVRGKTMDTCQRKAEKDGRKLSEILLKLILILKNYE